MESEQYMNDLFEKMNGANDDKNQNNHLKRKLTTSDDEKDTTNNDASLPSKKKSEALIQIENKVFGGKDYVINNLAKEYSDVTKIHEQIRQPAWHDSDDEECMVGDIKCAKKDEQLYSLNKSKSYKEFLVNKFNRVRGTPIWANLDRKFEEDSDEELLKTAGYLVKPSSTKLTPTNIDMRRLKDLNRATYSEKKISSLQFHPTSTVGLVTGLSGIASLYAIDGRKNEKLHSVKFDDFSISCCKILPNGTEIILGGYRKYFFSYDLMQAQETRIFLPKIMTKFHKFVISPCGKYIAVVGRFGEIHLMDTISKELLYTMKQENLCTDLKFTMDSKNLITHSDGQEISIFNLRQQKIEHFFYDDGCINGKTIAISPNGNYIASGSSEGVVNLYRYNDVFQSTYPLPKKIIYNLSTSISDTKFNHTSEILGICSAEIQNAVKFVHVASETVFANFPRAQSKLGNVNLIEFSPATGFAALGTISNKVPLFRLKHFENY